jgi:hypothetical protein
MSDRFFRPNYEKDRDVVEHPRGVLAQVGVAGVPQHGLGPLRDVNVSHMALKLGPGALRDVHLPHRAPLIWPRTPP